MSVAELEQLALLGLKDGAAPGGGDGGDERDPPLFLVSSMRRFAELAREVPARARARSRRCGAAALQRLARRRTDPAMSTPLNNPPPHSTPTPLNNLLLIQYRRH